LKPVALTKYGIPARNKEERIAALVERRIATLLGRNPVSLQDFAVAAVRRRQTGANTLQKESSKQATNPPDVSSLPRSSTDEAAQKIGGEAGRPGTLWSGCGLRKVVDIRAVADTVLTEDSPPSTARTQPRLSHSDAFADLQNAQDLDEGPTMVNLLPGSAMIAGSRDYR
jgi:hypothetical protein